MPPKPRPHGKPKPPGPSRGIDRRLLAILAVAGALVAAVAVALAVGLGGGDDGGSDARAALEAAGCTLTAVEALPGTHSVTTPDGSRTHGTPIRRRAARTTRCPRSGARTTEPVNQAQLVHNLEHGGIAIQYGDDVPAATVRAAQELRTGSPARDAPRPVPAPGNKIALGAWVTENASEPTRARAYLAKCDAFDEGAFAAFFDAYQFKGPERFPPDTLLPGRT